MFPFFMLNSYPSAMNYDMCSTNPWNSLNLHMNQAWDDMLARQTLFNVPMMNFNNMTLYGNGFGSNSYLLDPNYALQQLKFMNNGMSMFGNVGNVGGFGNLTTNPWNMQFGNTNGTSSRKEETAEDKLYNKRYTKLLALCKKLEKSGELDEVTETNLSAAIKNTKGTPKEKFERLQKAYKEIDKEIVKNFIINTEKVGGDKFDEVRQYENSFHGKLTSAGYEYEASAVDDEISNLKEAIKKVAKNPNQENTSTILGECGFLAQSGEATYNILDVLSSWNTQNKGTSSRNIISFISSNYPSNEADKAEAKGKVLAPIVKALTTEARKYLSSLDSASKTKLESAIKNVEKLLEQSDRGVAAGLANAFDRLYVLTREAAIVTLQNEMIQNYGSIDPELFNDELFIQETIDDLKDEGVLDGNAVEVRVSDRRRQVAESNSAPVAEAEEAEETEGADNATSTRNARRENEQIAELKNGNVLETLNAKYKDAAGNEYDVVRETKATGNREEARLFIVTEEGLKELKNVKYENGEYKVKSAEVRAEISETITKASDIKRDYDKQVKKEADAAAAEEAQKEEETRKAEVEKLDAKDKAAAYNEKDEEAQAIGKQIAKDLIGYTTDSEQYSVLENVTKITDKNVMQVLRGYYDHKFGGEHFFSQLENETGFANKEYIAKKVLGNVIAHLEVLAKAADDEVLKKDIENDIKELKDCLENNVFKKAKGYVFSLNYGKNTVADCIILKYIKRA